MADNIMGIGESLIAEFQAQPDTPAIAGLKKKILELRDAVQSQPDNVLKGLHTQTANLTRMVQLMHPPFCALGGRVHEAQQLPEDAQSLPAPIKDFAGTIKPLVTMPISVNRRIRK